MAVRMAAAVTVRLKSSLWDTSFRKTRTAVPNIPSIVGNMMHTLDHVCVSASRLLDRDIHLVNIGAKCVS